MGKSPFERRQGRAGLLALAASIVCGVAGGSLLRWGDDMLAPTGVFVALVVVFMFGILATLPWWRSLDSMQREAQYFSWHWGAVVGGTAALGAIIAFAGLETELMRGALLLIIAQMVGYGLFWAVWMHRHKGTEA